MADSLHTRYMAASAAWRTHRKGCATCRYPGQHCEDGRTLFERFADLQDAYLRTLRAP
ncbi:hypothetical protein [Streptomyces sp. NPDC008125]|uniref:hypothetical protein n=1 Tax=Streptomyces sp. NPDC008125 TaxID=3364811 RepID=UPI0036EF5F0C